MNLLSTECETMRSFLVLVFSIFEMLVISTNYCLFQIQDAADMQDDNKEEAEDDNDKADDEDADQNGK